MKKIIVLLLSFAFVLSLAACSSDGDNTNQSTLDTEDIGTQLATSIYICIYLLDY